MDIHSGKIYLRQEDIDSAKARDEQIVGITDDLASRLVNLTQHERVVELRRLGVFGMPGKSAATDTEQQAEGKSA